MSELNFYSGERIITVECYLSYKERVGCIAARSLSSRLRRVDPESVVGRNPLPRETCGARDFPVL